MKHITIETALLESQSIINHIKNLPDNQVLQYDYSWIEPAIKKIWSDVANIKGIREYFLDEYTSSLLFEYILAIIKSKVAYLHNSYNYKQLVAEEIVLEKRWTGIIKDFQGATKRLLPFNTANLPGNKLLIKKGYMVNPKKLTNLETLRKKYINEVLRKKIIISKIIKKHTDKFKVYFIGSVISPKIFHSKSDVDIAIITHVDDITAKRIKNDLRKLGFSFGKLDVYIFGEIGYIRKSKGATKTKVLFI